MKQKDEIATSLNHDKNILEFDLNKLQSNVKKNQDRSSSDILKQTVKGLSDHANK